jgi:SAM-dependent methyltransferase
MLDLPLGQRLDALAKWYEGSSGQYVWQREKLLLDAHLPQLFGYHLLSLGVCPHLSLADASPIHHRIAFSPAADARDVSACSAFHQLPIANESIDVALLHHALDYSEDPHQLLRETARSLMPYGHVLIFGFQQWSAVGMQQTTQRILRENNVASHRFMGVNRIHDWLKLLDFEIIKSRHTVYVPPQLGESLRERLQWFERFAWGAQLPFGSVYFILARKTVTGVTPIVSPWEKVAARNPLAVLTPRPLAPSDTVH